MSLSESLERMALYGTPAEWRSLFAGGLPEPLWRLCYFAYLKSVAWAQKRNAVLHKSSFCCERCDFGANQVHHRTYARIGNEAEGDLEALCQRCHEKHHRDERRVALLPLAVQDTVKAIGNMDTEKGTVPF